MGSVGARPMIAIGRPCIVIVSSGGTLVLRMCAPVPDASRCVSAIVAPVVIQPSCGECRVFGSLLGTADPVVSVHHLITQIGGDPTGHPGCCSVRFHVLAGHVWWMTGVVSAGVDSVSSSAKFVSASTTVDTLAGPICGLSHVRMALARWAHDLCVIINTVAYCPRNRTTPPDSLAKRG